MQFDVLYWSIERSKSIDKNVGLDLLTQFRIWYDAKCFGKYVQYQNTVRFTKKRKSQNGPRARGLPCRFQKRMKKTKKLKTKKRSAAYSKTSDKNGGTKQKYFVLRLSCELQTEMRRNISDIRRNQIQARHSHSHSNVEMLLMERNLLQIHWTARWCQGRWTNYYVTKEFKNDVSNYCWSCCSDDCISLCWCQDNNQRCQDHRHGSWEVQVTSIPSSTSQHRWHAWWCR